jgi:hypothetical protein
MTAFRKLAKLAPCLHSKRIESMNFLDDWLAAIIEAMYFTLHSLFTKIGSDQRIDLYSLVHDPEHEIQQLGKTK